MGTAVYHFSLATFNTLFIEVAHNKNFNIIYSFLANYRMERLFIVLQIYNSNNIISKSFSYAMFARGFGFLRSMFVLLIWIVTFARTFLIGFDSTPFLFLLLDKLRVTFLLFLLIVCLRLNCVIKMERKIN